MNVVVVGAGAVGGYLGELLRTAGAAITYAPRDLATVQPVHCDLAIVAVKAYDTPGAVATLQRLGVDGTTILTVQNGVGNEEQLVAAFGADAVVAGALTVPVERDAAGKPAAANDGGIGLAPCGAVPHNWLIAGFEQTKLPVRTYPDYRVMKWSKLMLNILANAQCAIRDVLPAELVALSGAFDLELRALREGFAVMRARKQMPIDLPRYPVPTLAAVARFPTLLARPILSSRIANARGEKPPSFLVDVRAGKHRTEVESLNGAIAAAGRELGIPAPVNAAFTELLKTVVADPSTRRAAIERLTVLAAG